MTYTISDKCTACGSCKDVCPVEAISEAQPAYKIDEDTCIDCGACGDACPAEAIAPKL